MQNRRTIIHTNWATFLILISIQWAFYILVMFSHPGLAWKIFILGYIFQIFALGSISQDTIKGINGIKVAVSVALIAFIGLLTMAAYYNKAFFIMHEKFLFGLWGGALVCSSVYLILGKFLLHAANRRNAVARSSAPAQTGGGRRG